MNRVSLSWFFTIAWLLVILWATLSPSDNLPKPSLISWEGADKVVHFGLFFTWTWTLFPIWDILKGKKPVSINRSLFIFVVLLIAGGTEILQLFVKGRSADLYDFLANVSGCVSAAILRYFIKRNTH